MESTNGVCDSVTRILPGINERYYRRTNCPGNIPREEEADAGRQAWQDVPSP